MVLDAAVYDHVAEGVTDFDSIGDLHWGLRAFVKWDAAHLLNIAGRGGYEKDMESVFFPMYPMVIRFIHHHFTQHVFGGEGNEMNVLVVSAVGVNLLLYPLASVLLWNLLESWKVALNWKRQAVTVHICANPANVFFLSGYSETLFSVTTWFAMYLVSEQRYIESWSAKLGAVVAFFVASYTRSNGMLNACFGLNALLLRDKSQALVRPLLTSIALGMAALLPLLINDMTNTFRYCDSIIQGGSLAYADSCKILGERDVDPLRFLNVAQVQKYLQRLALNRTFFYSYVQKKYWDVDLFASYQFRQIPNILLATPSCAIALYVLLASKSGQQRVMTTERIHLFLTLIVGVTFAHIQITTRLLMSACPIMYLGIAEILEGSSIIELKVAMVAYLALFSVVGVGLHCNWYPWT